MSISNNTSVWLRAETKPGEARTPLTPQAAAELIAAGFEITVERSRQRAIPDLEYSDVGCIIAQPGAWQEAPVGTFILGLKELPETGSALRHQHIYFAHAYKEQKGWRELLERFRAGGGELLDLEYLYNQNNRRIAAFGYWAGFAGAALAILSWCGQSLQKNPSLSGVGSWQDKNLLINDVQKLLNDAFKIAGIKPRILLIGALGRVGQGATDLARSLELEITQWDMQETAVGGPFVEILEHDIFINCVLVSKPLPPFITPEFVDQPGRILSVIADVSCDPYGEYNPVPLYSRCTTFAKPVLRLKADPFPLDLIAIDNLPSMLPVEASIDFCQQLLPALLHLGESENPIWQGARSIFQRNIDRLEVN